MFWPTLLGDVKVTLADYWLKVQDRPTVVHLVFNDNFI